MRANRILLDRLEAAVALAQQDIHTARIEECPCTRYGEVEMAVAVEVCYRQPLRRWAGGVGAAALERPVALAQQDSQPGRLRGRYREIEMAVAVEVPHGYKRGTRAWVLDSVGLA